MKKRSDKFIALLLCAFMAFSLIAAAADVPVETPAPTETPVETPAPTETPVETPAPTETPVETPAPTETPAETPAPTETPVETPAPTETPVETPAPTETPVETPAPTETPADPEDPVELKTASLNGDAAGMNFTVAGDLPQNSKLQVKAIDVSCNDYIVGNYLSDVDLPQGAAMAYELSILIVEEQDGVKQETPYVPTAANHLTVSVSGSEEDCFSAMTAYHLPGVTAQQVETVVKALAEGEVIPEDLPAAQPAALDADGNPLRYYNQMNVTAYGEGKQIFAFEADSLSVFYLVAEVGADHVDGCAGEGCTVENCPCPCHSLYARLMACTTLDELFALVDAATEEELSALTENQKRQVEAKITALGPEPLPPVVLEESKEPVAGEIIYPTKNFAWVAPFGSPVVG